MIMFAPLNLSLGKGGAASTSGVAVVASLEGGGGFAREDTSSSMVHCFRKENGVRVKISIKR